MSKEYSEIVRESGRIQDFYSDFSTQSDSDSKTFIGDSGFDAKDHKILMKLLFPDSAAGIFDGKTIWERIKNLYSGEEKNKPSEVLKKFVAQKIRIYYFDGNIQSDGGGDTHKQILEFYGEVTSKPSPSPAAKPKGKAASAAPQPASPPASPPAAPAGGGSRPSAYTSYDQTNYVTVKSGLQELLKQCLGDSPSNKKLPALTMILVDTPDIDLKLRNCDVTSTFLNYTPGIVASQIVPYLDVMFSLERKVTAQEAELNVMSPLKFLLGSQPIGESGANKFLYDSYTARRIREKRKLTSSPEEFLKKQIANAEQESKSAASGKNPAKKTRKTPAATGSTELKSEPAEIKEDITITGMEMFTMPQTLINMDYDQFTTPRYNPVINSTVPFGSILSFKIDLTSQGLGFSYKTGLLTLKIFDRSRLVEIADFLNPRLYSKATLWITYGWRAPSQSNNDPDENKYFSLINQNMMKREAYGISNSSISITDDGTCTVTLNLFMKFAHELSTVSETTGGAAFNSTLEFQQEKISELRDIAKRIGLQGFLGTGAGDVRGSVLVKSALEAKIPQLDSKGLETEIKSINDALKGSTDPNVIRFNQLVSELYSVAKGGDKSSTMANLDAAAKIASEDRFSALKKTEKLDLWSVVNLGDKTNSKFEPNNEPDYIHPLSKLYPTLGLEKNGQSLDAGVYGRFGAVSFARLFATYFSTATTYVNDSSPIDEYQVIFYNFNDYAGFVSNMNIGEFPIDMTLLTKHYEEEIVKQKGENFTLIKFLEIVRISQFGNIRHKAFGFSDLFDDKGNVVKEKNDEFVKRQFYNQGLGAGFTLPAVDFYLETSAAIEQHVEEDLLVTFQAGAALLNSSLNGTSKPRGYKKILRIHIYDKASMAHKEAYDIMRSSDGTFVEVENSWTKRYRRNQHKIMKSLAQGKFTKTTTAPPKPPKPGPPGRRRPQAVATGERKLTVDEYEKSQPEFLPPEETTNGVNYGYRVRSFNELAGAQTELAPPVVDKLTTTDLVVKTMDFGKGDPKMTFDKVKRQISKFVPTIIYGSNGTLIKSLNYGSEQDAMLSTIMMLRNKTDDENVTNVNGSSKGDLPLRVIPGQLSISTMGCPLLEYMQQYFVDLGTGTTIDNLYNITGISHNFSPGSFISEIKFTFADAYGKYEGAQPLEVQIKSMSEQIKTQVINSNKSEGGGKKKK